MKNLAHWLLPFIFTLTACGGGGGSSTSDKNSGNPDQPIPNPDDTVEFNKLVGEWYFEVAGNGHNRSFVLAINVDQKAILHRLNQPNNCSWRNDSVIKKESEQWVMPFDEGPSFILSRSNNDLAIHIGDEFYTASNDTLDISGYTDCDDEPEPDNDIDPSELIGTWSLDEETDYVTITSDGNYQAYIWNPSQSCYDGSNGSIEKSGETSFTVSDEDNQIELILSQNGDGWKYSIQNFNGTALPSNTDTKHLSPMCGEQPEPDPEEISLEDISGTWSLNGEQEYIRIQQNERFDFYEWSESESCYTHTYGSISKTDKTQFLINDSSNNSFSVSLTKNNDGWSYTSLNLEGLAQPSNTDIANLDPICGSDSKPMYDTSLTLNDILGAYNKVSPPFYGQTYKYIVIEESLAWVATKTNPQSYCHNIETFAIKDLSEGIFELSNLRTKETQLLGFSSSGNRYNTHQVNSENSEPSQIGLKSPLDTGLKGYERMEMFLNVCINDVSINGNDLLGTWKSATKAEGPPYFLSSYHTLSSIEEEYILESLNFDNDPKRMCWVKETRSATLDNNELWLGGIKIGTVKVSQTNSIIKIDTSNTLGRVSKPIDLDMCIEPDPNITSDDVIGVWSTNGVGDSLTYYHFDDNLKLNTYYQEDEGCYKRYTSELRHIPDEFWFSQHSYKADYRFSNDFAFNRLSESELKMFRRDIEKKVKFEFIDDLTLSNLSTSALDDRICLP